MNNSSFYGTKEQGYHHHNATIQSWSLQQFLFVIHLLYKLAILYYALLLFLLICHREQYYFDLFQVNVMALAIGSQEAFKSMKERAVDDGMIIHICR